MKRLPGVAVAGLSAIGAGIIHGSAIGIHAEHPQLARLFLTLTVLQLGIGLFLLLRPAIWQLPVSVAVNTGAVSAWVITRITGISFIDGLEVREAPQLADTLCAGLGAVAAAASLGALLVGERELPSVRLRFPALAVTVFALPAMWTGATHSHADESSHAHDTGLDAANDTAHDTAHDTGSTAITATSVAVDPVTGESSTVTLLAWPRAYDPAAGIDISGVPGVSTEQEARARTLIENSLRDLPRWADYDVAISEGWKSIGDGSTGFEHVINRSLIQDDKFLDPTAPESLVYRVEGNTKTLVSAMFIAKAGTPIDDPVLLDYAGPLMQWHVHNNLCWGRNAQGATVIVGLTDANGNCPPGSVNTGGATPMVHVWITPHECGPFAALEGAGAGTADVSDDQRVDMCNEHAHPTPGATPTTIATSPTTTVAAASFKDDGSPRISLAGFAGVSAEQQARAEDLIYRTRTILPKFATTESARAAGFSSIGDSATGVEHYINWTYINDEHELDPDYPESLVYAVGAGGARTLVSAMYMVGDEYTLETVPDIGGSLTQWHIHNNLCFSQDPMVSGSTRVVGVTTEDGPCNFGIKLHANPMIHVWLTPQVCGPFAALEGVGAGQIKPGEERLCDQVHSHG